MAEIADVPTAAAGPGNTKAKALKAPAGHPDYFDMVVSAVTALKDSGFGFHRAQKRP